jgi:hypothetical protein
MVAGRPVTVRWERQVEGAEEDHADQHRVSFHACAVPVRKSCGHTPAPGVLRARCLLRLQRLELSRIRPATFEGGATVNLIILGIS